MEVTNIEATTLPDAWFQAVLAAYNNGFEHKVDKGSNVGEIRKELDYIVINIRHPGANPMIPDMPPGFGIPPATACPGADSGARGRARCRDSAGHRSGPRDRCVVQSSGGGCGATARLGSVLERERGDHGPVSAQFCARSAES